MGELLAISLTAALINNFVLVQFLGLCPLMGSSASLSTAFPMTMATMFVITIATILTHSIYNRVLLPLDLAYLKILLFVVVIASIVQGTEIFIRYVSPLLHQLLGIYLPLITSNCAILGVALMASNLPLHQAVAMGIGAALGFGIVLTLFASIRQHLDQNTIPLAFRGSPILLVTIGILALAFSGFKGVLP